MLTNRILFLRRILIISLLLLAFSSLGAATIFSDSFNDGSVSGSWSTVGSVSEQGGELDIHNPGDCNYDKAAVDLGNRNGDITIDQDWRVDISGWYENPRYKVIVDGSTVFSDSYPRGRDYSGSGSYTDTVNVDGNVKVRFLVDPSGACGNGDHYHTDLYLDNVDITYTADTEFSSTSNSAAPAGAAWIEGSDLHWADGTTEYFFNSVSSRDGAQAIYHFDSGSGQTAADDSGNGNSGTLGGSTSGESSDPSWVAGKHNNALSFDGSDDYLETSSEIDIGNSDWTVTSWYYPRASDDYGHIFTSSSDQRNFATKVSEDLNPYFYSSDGRTDGSDASKSLSLNEWQHLAYVYDGSSVKIYLDGSKIVDQAVSGLSIPSDRYRVQGGNNEFVSAMHDETSIYNRALSSQEIQQIYQGAGSKVGGPKGAWWIEGSAMHWIGENGYERAYTGTDTGNNPSAALPGNVWIENSMIHYIDASGNERKT